MLGRTILLLGLAVMGTVSASAAWYWDEASFLADLDTVHYCEDFADFTFGDPLDGQTTWVAPGANGFGFSAGAVNGLYSTDGALSTNQDVDLLTLDLSGQTTTAFGGVFANTGLLGDKVAGSLDVTLSTGDHTTIVLGDGESAFLGWIGDTALADVSIMPTDWAEIDHVYVGRTESVPEPASLMVLSVGALATARLRRK